MRIIDTHAHYDDEAFDEDREELLKKLLKEGGVELAVNMGAGMHGAEKSAAYAAEYDFIYAGTGIHPDDVGVFEHAGISREEAAELSRKEAADGDGGDPDPEPEKEAAGDLQIAKKYREAMRFSSADDALEHLIELCRRPKTLTLGEIGLDYHWMIEPKEVQKKWFIRQLRLAAELDLPINVHSRDAAQDTFDIIKEYHSGTTGGIIHCYSGSAELAQEYIRMGYYLGIGGVVTYKNSKVLKRVVTEIPLEYLVTETDSPYLAPSPHRGERNDSRNIRYVIEKIAELKGLDPENCAEILRKNARDVYRIGEA
jgi:TatD DNase family protein